MKTLFPYIIDIENRRITVKLDDEMVNIDISEVVEKIEESIYKDLSSNPTVSSILKIEGENKIIKKREEDNGKI